MVIPTDNNMAYIYYFIRTQPCLQVHSEIHNYSNTRITQIPKPSNPSTHVPFFYCIRPIPLYVPSGLWHVGMSHQKISAKSDTQTQFLIPTPASGSMQGSSPLQITMQTGLKHRFMSCSVGAVCPHISFLNRFIALIHYRCLLPNFYRFVEHNKQVNTTFLYCRTSNKTNTMHQDWNLPCLQTSAASELHWSSTPTPEYKLQKLNNIDKKC